MTVFKSFLQILKKNKGIIIMYTIMLLTFGGLNMQANQSNLEFEASKPKVVIVNKDNEEGITKNLIEYIKANCEIPEIDDTEEARNDALFYEMANLIVYIPENYNNDFMNGQDVQLTIKKGTSYYASYAEMILQRYIKVAKIYQENINNGEDIFNKINETLDSQTKTEIVSKLDTTSLSRASRYFNFASYSFLACLIYVICLVLTAFNDEKIKKRTVISSFNYKKFNRILFFSNMMYSFVLWAIYAAMSFMVLGDVMNTANALIMIINSLVFVICATSLSFFIGSMIKNKNIIGGIVNVVALGSSFLCGAFVPTQWLPDFVKTIAHVLPTYYYIEANDILTELEEVNFDTLTPVFVNMGIVLAFSVVFIILTNVYTKRKRKIG